MRLSAFHIPCFFLSGWEATWVRGRWDKGGGGGGRIKEHSLWIHWIDKLSGCAAVRIAYKPRLHYWRLRHRTKSFLSFPHLLAASTSHAFAPCYLLFWIDPRQPCKPMSSCHLPLPLFSPTSWPLIPAGPPLKYELPVAYWSCTSLPPEDR